MTTRSKTVLLIGATGDLGEQFTRRFHAQGKKVIATGRRQDRLHALRSELDGVETVQWDITDFSEMSKKSSQILSTHPDIDCVFVLSGIATIFSFFDQKSTTDDEIISEIQINLTARALLTRYFLPHLSELAKSGRHAELLFIGSGQAYTPMGTFPLYGATYAASHALTIVLRQQVAKQPDQNVKDNLHVIQLVAPYVETKFNDGFRALGLGIKGMEIEEFMNAAMEGLTKTDESGRPLKEITVGTATPRLNMWRDNLGKMMESMGLAT